MRLLSELAFLHVVEEDQRAAGHALGLHVAHAKEFNPLVFADSHLLVLPLRLRALNHLPLRPVSGGSEQVAVQVVPHLQHDAPGILVGLRAVGHERQVGRCRSHFDDLARRVLACHSELLRRPLIERIVLS